MASMLKEQDLQEHISQILKGNTKSEHRVYNEYKPYINVFLNKNYFNNFDEDDLSEIMIKIFKGLKTFDFEKGSFNTWAINIAKHHMIDKFRKNVLSTTSLNVNEITFFETNSTYDSDFNYDYNSPSDNILRDLKPQDQEMVKLKYVEGYSYSEIGKMYQLTSSTVSNKINYAKNKIKKNLKGIK